MSKKLTEGILKCQAENREVVAKMEAMNDALGKEDRAFTDAEDKEYQELRAKSDKLVAEMDRLDDLLKRSTGSSMFNAIATQSESIRSEGEPNKPSKQELEARSAFEKFLRTGNDSEYRSIVETRDSLTGAQQVGVDELGGYLLPHELLSKEILDTLASEVIIRKYADVVSIAGYKQFSMPTIADGLTNASWIGETEKITSSKMEFGQKTLNAFKLAVSVIVSNFLAQSSGNITKEVVKRITREIAEAMEREYMVGSGSGKPLGIFTPSANGIPAARDFLAGATGTLLDPKLFTKNIEGNMKSGYRKRAVLLVGKELYLEINNLEDKNGRPLMRTDYKTGMENYFKGYRIIETDFLPAESEYLGALIDLSTYKIADAQSIILKILDQTHAEYDCLNYQATMWTGGMPVQPEACVRIKKPA